MLFINRIASSTESAFTSKFEKIDLKLLFVSLYMSIDLGNLTSGSIVNICSDSWASSIAI